MSLMWPRHRRIMFFLAFIIFCMAKVSQSQCIGQECKFFLPIKKGQNLTAGEIVKLVDAQVKRIYWYYLRDAVQIYQSNVQVANKETLIFYIYKNTIGTFLVILSKNQNGNQVQVNTFARLGSGFLSPVQTQNQPAQIQPFIISLKLSSGQLILDFNDKNIAQTSKLTVTQKNPSQNNQMAPSSPSLGASIPTSTAVSVSVPQKIKKLDQHIRKTYWYYLDNAILINSQSLSTTQKIYAIFTYINITGTYLIISSLDNNNNSSSANGGIRINTFIRLGGGASTDQIRQIDIQPSPSPSPSPQPKPQRQPKLRA